MWTTHSFANQHPSIHTTLGSVHPKFIEGCLSQDATCKIYPNGRHLYLPMVGYVRMVMHRVLEGAMRYGTVSRTKSGNYFVSIQVEVEIREPIFAGVADGLDLGLRDFVTLSSGEKVRLRLARLDERIANQRRDYHHNLSHQFVEENQFIRLEDLNIQGMTSSGKIHWRCWLVSIDRYVGVQS